MVINLPPGAAVSVTRDAASSSVGSPAAARESSRIAKRTFDELYGTPVPTQQLVGLHHGVHYGVAALQKNLEAMWPTEGDGHRDDDGDVDVCLCHCAKEVDFAAVLPGERDEASDAEPDDYADESDMDDDEVAAEAPLLWTENVTPRPAVLHPSTLSCFYSERELGVLKEAFEILNGDVGEPDLVTTQGNTWAIEAREKEEGEREAKRCRTEGAAERINVEAADSQDVDMKDAKTSQETPEGTKPQSTVSKCSQYTPWSFVSDEEPVEVRTPLPPSPHPDYEDCVFDPAQSPTGGNRSENDSDGSRGIWIPM